MGDTVVGEVSGNWKAKSFTISIGGNQVAVASGKSGDSYSIEVSAGVDSAFITMIAIALNEIIHDKGLYTATGFNLLG